MAKRKLLVFATFLEEFTAFNYYKKKLTIILKKEDGVPPMTEVTGIHATSIVNKDKHLFPLTAVFFAVMAVSFASIIIKSSEAPATVLAFYRLFLTTLVLAPLAYIWHRKETLNMKEYLRPMLLSGAFLAGHFLSWISSLQYTTVASSVVLVTMHPAIVLTFDALVFKEKIHKRTALGVLIALSGSIVIGAGDFAIGGQAFFGDLLALLGAFFMAGYLIIGRQVRQNLPVLPYTSVVYGFASFIILIVILTQGTPLYPYPVEEYLRFAALALLPTIFGHTVFNWALAYLPTTYVSLSILGEPVGSSILAAIFLREFPNSTQTIGGTLILTGLFIALWRPHKSSRGKSNGKA